MLSLTDILLFIIIFLMMVMIHYIRRLSASSGIRFDEDEDSDDGDDDEKDGVIDDDIIYEKDEKEEKDEKDGCHCKSVVIGRCFQRFSCQFYSNFLVFTLSGKSSDDDETFRASSMICKDHALEKMGRIPYNQVMVIFDNVVCIVLHESFVPTIEGFDTNIGILMYKHTKVYCIHGNTLSFKMFFPDPRVREALHAELGDLWDDVEDSYLDGVCVL